MRQLVPSPDFAGLTEGFRWRIPPDLNIVEEACDRWARREPDRLALIELASGGAVPVTYGMLAQLSLRLASALARRGVRRGDRIAILLPQGRHVPATHFAAYRLGAVAVPLAALFGIDALSYRLRDSGARVLVTDAAGLAKLRRIQAPLPDLETVVSIDGADGDALGFDALVDAAAAAFDRAATGPDDPALMIYTSGTTGPPKGALHAHRVLAGHMPGVELPHAFMPQPGDRIWTPADWAWAGGLLNALLPSLALGVPVIAGRNEKFDPEAAFALMADQKVRNAFLPPTALRMLRGVTRARQRFDYDLRSVCSAGEALGEETLAWSTEVFGRPVNEAYGQTECNLVLASCAALGVLRPGTIGKAVPGHTVAVIRPDGRACEPDELGQIAVRRPDPVMFLGYWNQPKATEAKFLGDWLLTGDVGAMDAEGYVRFVGRDDDVITSSGYRIGPGEIEDCLAGHPAVALAAAVGKPDPLRTEIVKAFVVLRAGFEPSDALAAEIKGHVRTRLSAHEYPREVAFVDELPMTTTGKIIRAALRERG